MSLARQLCLSFALLLTFGCDGPGGPTCTAEECACDPAGCACPNGSSCGWAEDIGCGADASHCHLQCAANTCVARCGDVCEAGCTAGAICDVVGAAGATLYCSRSTCELRAGAGTTATCRDDATCLLTCTATPCGIDCATGASCMMQCPGEGAFHVVERAQSCPIP